MSINKGMMASKTPEWETPQDLFDKLDAEFHFTLDPCCTHENAKCDRHFTKEDNGLGRCWYDNSVFMNPPYGREIVKWMQKAYMSSKYNTTVVCLVPARTDTAWWHDYAMKGEVRFVRGRIKFGGYKWNAPFPSAVVIFKAERNKETVPYECQKCKCEQYLKSGIEHECSNGCGLMVRLYRKLRH